MNPALKLLLVLLILGTAAAAQQPAAPAAPQAVWTMTPPAGYRSTKALNGFEDTVTGAFIFISPLRASSQAILTRMFSDSSMRRLNMTLLRIDSIVVSGTRVPLYISSQQGRGKTFIRMTMAAAAPDAEVLVTAGYPAGSGTDTLALRAAIRNLIKVDRPAIDPLEAAPFTLNTEGTDFKPVKFSGGSLLYAADGKIPTDMPVLIVGISHGKTAISSKKAFALNRLRQLPGGGKARLLDSAEVMIDGMPGYELLAESSAGKGTTGLLYQVVLYAEDGNYFMILGQAKERTAGLPGTYRRIARSFRRK